MRPRPIATLAVLVVGSVAAAVQVADLTTSDADLRVDVIDSSPAESFLGVRVDAAG